MNHLKNILGEKFGSLTVIGRAKSNFELFGKGAKEARWNCLCDCGDTHTASSYYLRNTPNIGCLSCMKVKVSKARTTHKGLPKRLYQSWANMKNRCTNSKLSNWDRYGGRGILVCDEWQEYEPFRDWALANGYTDKLTLERIDNDQNYHPSNCTWVTRKVQSRNRSNVTITVETAAYIRMMRGIVKGVELAKQFGTSGDIVSKIQHGKSWVEDANKQNAVTTMPTKGVL